MLVAAIEFAIPISRREGCVDMFLAYALIPGLGIWTMSWFVRTTITKYVIHGQLLRTTFVEKWGCM